MNTEATAAVTGFHPFIVVGLILDACLILTLAVLKLLPLGFSLVLVAKNQAVTNLKKCLTAIFSLAAIYFLFNTEPQSILSLRAFVLVVLCGTLIFRKLFEISTEKSFVSCLLYCFLSLLMEGYATRLAGKLIPDRVTFNGQLAKTIDRHVRLATDNPALPSSTGFVPALLRAGWRPDSGGFIRELVEALFAPVKAGVQAKQQIAKINTVAVQRLALVDAIAHDSTNADVGVDATNSPLEGMEAGTHEKTDSVPAVATAGVSNSPPVAAGRPPVAFAPSCVTKGSLSALSPEERQRWREAEKKLVISGIGSSGKSAYVLIGGHVVRPGTTYTVVHEGTAYVFEFKGLAAQGVGRWVPVLPEEKPAEVTVAF
jgi:hypothetical protein